MLQTFLYIKTQNIKNNAKTCYEFLKHQEIFSKSIVFFNKFFIRTKVLICLCHSITELGNLESI